MRECQTGYLTREKIGETRQKALITTVAKESGVFERLVGAVVDRGRSKLQEHQVRNSERQVARLELDHEGNICSREWGQVSAHLVGHIADVCRSVDLFEGQVVC